MVDKIAKSRVYREVKEKIFTLMVGGLSFVAALAWNEAIKAFLDEFLPKENTLIAKFAYAIFITAVIVILSEYFLKASAKEKEEGSDT